MNRATTENIKAAEAAGLKNVSALLCPAGGLIRDFFADWDKVRKSAPGAFVEVNAVLLYTDFDADVTYDDYCRLVYCQRPEDMEREEKKEVERIKWEHRNFRRNIPKIYEKLIAGRALSLIAAQDRSAWEEAVRHCLEGMYGDLCIRSALDMIEQLRDGDEFKEVIEKSEVYGHTGNSWWQTLALVRQFGGVRGKSFFDYNFPKK